MQDILGTIFILGLIASVILFVRYRFSQINHIESDLSILVEQNNTINDMSIEEAGFIEVGILERHQRGKIGL